MQKFWNESRLSLTFVINFSTACTTCLYIFIDFMAALVIDDILAFEIGGLDLNSASIYKR